MTLRNTEVNGNQSTNGGGILNTAILRLTTTKITNNTALAPAPGGAGGILNTGAVTTDPHTVIVGNRPTNCVGNPVPNCFG